MIVIGLDPGYEKSAYVIFNGVSITQHDIVDNPTMMTRIDEIKGIDATDDAHRVLVVEQISMGGMIAGAETFETCFWSGRFVQKWSPRRWDRIKRMNVKDHICHTRRANDSHVRAALIERFGPTTEKAIGKKSQPGPLYGISSHKWAALAVAVTWFDQHGHQPEEIRPGVVPEF